MKGENKTEPFFTRLSASTSDRIVRLMREFGYRSRDVFTEEALHVLEQVREGKAIPDCVAEAQQRQQRILLERRARREDDDETA